MITKENFELCSPWMVFFHQVEAFFREDDQVHAELDNDNYKISIYVDDDDKANALSMIIPKQKVLGNIIVTIDIIPANGTINPNNVYDPDVFKRAFKDNTAIVDFVHIDVKGLIMDFIMCKPIVVQMKNDSLHDPKGIVSTLYEDLASEIFVEHPGIFFSTDQVPVMKKNENSKFPEKNKNPKFPKDEM